MPSLSAARSKLPPESCQHLSLTQSPSPHATTSRYRPYSDQQILGAMTGKRKHSPEAASGYCLEAFPAPLVLPDDEIDLDPRYPPQSVRSWLNSGVRNQITARQNVIYVAAPPKIDASVRFMDEWCRPQTESWTGSDAMFERHLDISGIISYLKAFYHGLEIKVLPAALAFTSWDESPKPKSKSKSKTKSRREHGVDAVALSTGTEAVRIRVRTTPPSDTVSPAHMFPYTHQLDLNDLTDAAISMLPSDAYALLLLTTHDIYESNEDDFCCGRAWGASRVAIVSSARYHTLLDGVHGVDQEHLWPASHCKDFINKMSDRETEDNPLLHNNWNKRCKISNDEKVPCHATPSPLWKALEAFDGMHAADRSSSTTPSNIFLFRLCRTASHELGHCFGLDHCMYKACVMQGTATVAEDMRQPPYLCPVCEMKVAWAVARADSSDPTPGNKTACRTGKKALEEKPEEEDDKDKTRLVEWKRNRCAAIEQFCKRYNGAFAPLGAWSAAFLSTICA